MSYKIIAICGPAGSGKSTLAQQVVKANPQIHEIISCTTRPIRENEKDGVDYIYLTGEQFSQKVLDGEMLEASCFNDWFYGTSYESLRSDCVNIGVFNPESLDLIRASQKIELVVFFLDVSEKNRLLRQLNREENPDVNEIIRRFLADKNDFLDLNFHYNALFNNTEEDLSYNIKVISSAIKKLEAKI